jgi:hypothetical protein
MTGPRGDDYSVIPDTDNTPKTAVGMSEVNPAGNDRL